MPDPSLAHSLQPSTKKHTQLLDREAFLSHLTQKDLSDARRYFDYARYKTRKHDKVEMGAGTIVGTLLGWLLGGGTWQGSIAVGFLAFFATLLVIFAFHWVRSPSAFHKAALIEAHSAKLLLEQEKARNAEPKLAGRIDCLEVDQAWDTENFGIDEENKCRLKASFTLRVTLWNESAAPTTVLGFRLHVLWTNGHHQAVELPVENYSVRYSLPRSEEWGYETKHRRLVAFRQDVEITNTNHQSGDLRFLARQIPSESSEQASVRKDVIFRLEALDRKGQAHKIYEGTWEGLPACGSIERDVEYFGIS